MNPRQTKTNETKKKRMVPDPGNLMLLLYTLLIALAVLSGGLATAEGASGPESTETGGELPLDDLRQGELYLPDATGATRPALYLGQEVTITVSGIVARVRVAQRFTNDGPSWVDGVYVFPLPDESAVDRLRMVVGDREIVGEIREREEARAIYEKARSEGRKSSLLSQQRPNIFTTRVANIGPGEQVTVVIEYQQLVQYTDSTFSVRFPMAITPRYIPGRPVDTDQPRQLSFGAEGWAQDTDQVPDASQITPPVARPESGEGPTTRLSVDLRSGFALDRLQSLYHQMAVKELEPDHHLLHFTGEVLADRDFVLEWQLAQPEQAEASLIGEERGNSRYLLLMLMPPRQPLASPVPRELIFILDVSGSMAGPSIRQAKEALRQALATLRSDDRFNVITFNDSARPFFPKAVAASDANLLEALDQLELIEADGGTEMRSALELALDGKSSHDRIRQVVFLTDGAVGNEQELFGLIHQRLGDSRLFTVGIGSAPNSYFMSRAATVGRGTHTAIGETEEVATRMATLLAMVAQPAVTDIAIETDDGQELEFEAYPSPIPDLYLGEPLMVALRTAPGVSGLKISGRAGGEAWQYQVDTATQGSRPGVASLWGRKKIRTLMESLALGAEESAVRTAVLATALEHRLVSRYTSLVAVDPVVSRPANVPTVKQVIKGAPPAGLVLDKVFGGGAQTATPAPLMLVIGLALVTLALALHGMRRWARRRC